MPPSYGGKGDPFHVTYKYILNNDIRYMYSGYPARYRGRREPDYPNFDMLRIAKENSTLRRRTLRTSRYGDNDRFLLPRAPAFRHVKPNLVTNIVDRLMKPTFVSQKTLLTEEEAEERRCVSEMKEQIIRKDAYPSFRSMSPEDVKRLSSRLYNTHTHMSKMKLRDADEVRNTLPIMKNSPDPDRMRNPPHQMHTMPVVDI